MKFIIRVFVPMFVTLFISTVTYAQAYRNLLEMTCLLDPTPIVTFFEKEKKQLVWSKKAAHGNKIMMWQKLGTREWVLVLLGLDGSMCIIATSPENNPGT